ncbi:hypothetical protein OY671_007799, partial [Metschnikowia pulcherrima]
MANGNSENPAQLSPRLAESFPVEVVAVELAGEAPRSVLTEVALRSVSHCANKRIDDFTRGRACARRGLGQLGVEGFSSSSGDKREPSWPPEIVGSITHTTGFAAAVVARSAQVQALGIDCEVIESVGQDSWERICTPAEQERLGRSPEAQAQRQAASIFAAKEAFSKAVGTGFKAGVFMKDIGVVNASSGAPTSASTGGAAARSARITPAGYEAVIHSTSTDDHPWAQAFVVIEARPLRPNAPSAQAETKPAAADDTQGVNWSSESRGSASMSSAVVGFHSSIAKPFYIPSISMMPNSSVGDRSVVSKYPYGWSWVSASFHISPRGMTRISPRTPAYGDIVIVVPPDRDE